MSRAGGMTDDYMSLVESYYRRLDDGTWRNGGLTPLVNAMHNLWLNMPRPARQRLVARLEERCQQRNRTKMLKVAE